MRVLILSQYFFPEPLFKPGELASDLKRRGHSVSVITGFPNYPKGEVYPGYRTKLIQRDMFEGMPVIRCALFPSHDNSSFKRSLNFFSFMLSSLLGGFFVGPCDVIYVFHPPLTIGVSAWLIGKLKRASVVYDVQDVWPESGVWSGMLKDSLVVNILHVLEKFVYERMTHILVVTREAKENLMGKGVAAGKLTVASHWVDEESYSKPDDQRCHAIRREYGFEGRFVLLFAGNIGLVQGLDTILRSAKLLVGFPEVLFVFVGDGTDKARLMSLAEEWGLTNTLFLQNQPIDDIKNFMACADVLILHLNQSAAAKMSIPTKTFAYMAAARPILAAVEGATAEMIESAKAGCVVLPENPEAMAKAILELKKLTRGARDAMGLAGLRYLRSNHSKKKVLDAYESILSTYSKC